MQPDVDTISWIRTIMAFAIVAALLGGLSYGLKYMAKRGMGNFGLIPQKNRRMHVVESLPLDVKHRLVIVKCDATEHVLLLGSEGSLVVSSQPVDESRTPS